MSINQSAPSLEIFTHEMLDGHGINVDYAAVDGRVQAMIIYKDSKQGGYGFSLDLFFKGELTNTAVGDDNIILTELSVNKASTWYDRKSGGDVVEYQLGSDDRRLLTPTLKQKILEKISRAEIKTILPQSLFSAAAEEEVDFDTNEVQRIAIDFESDHYQISLNSDDTASGYVTILIDGEIQFLTDFTATYEQVFERPVFSNGRLITAKTDKLANIKFTDMWYSNFANLETDEYDFDYDVLADDVALIKALIVKEVERKHEELAYPLGKQHPLVA